MVIVPQDLMDNLRYNQRKKAGDVGSQVIGIDKEMQSILTRSDLSQDDKIRLYNHALLKYGDIVEKKKEEKLDITLPEVIDEWDDMIDKQFTINNRSRAKNILDWIRSKGEIMWNDKGELDGHPGSNILTLLDDVSRSQPRDKGIEPIGMTHFVKKLVDSNLPRYLLSTHYQRYIDAPPAKRPRRLVSSKAKHVPTPPGTPPTPHYSPPPSPVSEWLTPGQ